MFAVSSILVIFFLTYFTSHYLFRLDQLSKNLEGNIGMAHSSKHPRACLSYVANILGMYDISVTFEKRSSFHRIGSAPKGLGKICRMVKSEIKETREAVVSSGCIRYFELSDIFVLLLVIVSGATCIFILAFFRLTD